MEKHNGWTNYATWRVNLEMFDGINPSDYWVMDDADIEYTLPESLKEWAESIITDYKTETNLAQDYALAFMSDVNWNEIARHLIDDHLENYEENDELATDDTRSYGTRNREQDCSEEV